MEIRFSLCLPRDAASVPIVRHICVDSLLKLKVAEECVNDIALAVTEACTNVLDHAEGSEDEYEVEVEISGETCEIRVTDTGTGFDHAGLGRVVASGGAESGRGVFLMRAFVDDLKFVSEPEEGTIVHLVKHLVLEPDSPLTRLTRPVIAAPSGDGAERDGSA